MHNKHLSIFVGITATVSLFQSLPAQAEAKIYQNISGHEDFILDPEGLAVLDSIGLSLTALNNGGNPAPGYDFSLELLPPSSDPDVRGSFSFFSYDAETKDYNFLGEREEFVGSLLFEVDTKKLALNSLLEIGNLSVSYFPTGEVLVADTISIGLPLFIPLPADLTVPFVPTVDLTTQTLVYDNVNFFTTQEFSDFLVAAGATTPVAGIKLAAGRLGRGFVEVDTTTPSEPTPVPEPSTLLGVLIMVSGAALRRRHQTAA